MCCRQKNDIFFWTNQIMLKKKSKKNQKNLNQKRNLKKNYNKNKN
jgi:hypothetical protein